MLHTADPQATLRDLIETRYPVYSEADITVESTDGPREETVDRVIRAVNGYLGKHTMADSETVMVDLGSRAYDIVIGEGVLARAGALMADVLGSGKRWLSPMRPSQTPS